MSLNRRRFIASCGTTAAATFVSSGHLVYAAQASGLPQRKDVNAPEAAADIDALSIAVDKMKKLPAGDARSWRKQAEIHGQILGGFGHCQHGNWYFLPWHRAYLYCFEEIVRELSTKKDFALPYWNWTKNRSLPAAFWGANNPLDNPARNGAPGSGRSITAQSKISDSDYTRFFSQTVISNILSTSDFETFGGDAVQKPGDRAGQGQLEGVPHNRIHTWVGGDMQTGGSPYDPIFWLHHCNVDRLWNEWSRRHPGAMPTENEWLGVTFRDFCDKSGAPTAIKVSDTLATANLGYEYATAAKAALAGPRVKSSVVTSISFSRDKLSDGVSSFTGRAVEPVTVRAKGALQEPEASSVETIRLSVRGIAKPKDGTIGFDVFLNCAKLSIQTPISDPSYVGSCAFFLHNGHAHGDDGGISFYLNLTNDFARLYGGRVLTNEEPLTVGLVPIMQSDENPQAMQMIDPSNVRIEVIQTGQVNA